MAIALPEIVILGIFFAVFLPAFAFWIWMLVDCAKAPEKPGSNERLLWILVLILAPFIGSLIYFFVIRQSRRSATRLSRRPAPLRTVPPALR